MDELSVKQLVVLSQSRGFTCSIPYQTRLTRSRHVVQTQDESSDPPSVANLAEVSNVDELSVKQLVVLSQSRGFTCSIPYQTRLTRSRHVVQTQDESSDPPSVANLAEVSSMGVRRPCWTGCGTRRSCLSPLFGWHYPRDTSPCLYLQIQ